MVLDHDLFSDFKSVAVSASHNGNQHIQEVKDDQEIREEEQKIKDKHLGSIT